MTLSKKLPPVLTWFGRRFTATDGLINTTDLLVATAATVILAAGVSGAVIGTMNDAKYGKAQPDAQALAGALSKFYKDTGKWPGQAEHAALTGTSKPAAFVVTAGTGATGDPTSLLPTASDTELSVAATTCGGASLEGFSGVSIDAGDLATATKFNLNDYLVRKPDETSYPSWQGPYLQQELKTDPWDRGWVLNLMPLYCSETIADATGAASASTAGTLGYAWIISGGANRTVTTPLTSATLDTASDDAGVNLGKLIMRSGT